MFRFTIAVCLTALVFLTGLCLADIPKLINYQGMLTDEGGNALTDTVSITFRIYNDTTSVAEINKKWEETHTGVEVINGLFNVMLGRVVSLNLDFSEDYWLDITVGAEHLPDRIRLGSVGYAYRALVADSAAVAGSGGGVGGGWVDDGTVVRLENASDSVGIGTTDPDYNLDVRSSGTAIYGRTTGGPWNMGLYGRAENDGFGVLGSSTSGHAVHGVTASGYAGYFEGPKNYFSGEVGIGTTEPTEMLHVENSASGVKAFLKIETSHPSDWGEAGMRIETPDNMWHLRMDDDSHNNLPDTGSLALRSQNSGIEVMTWTNDGQVGIRTTEPSAEMDVNGDLEVTGAYKGSISSASGNDGASFPRPAYNSGWEAIGKDEALTLDHNIGSDPDNFVVDLQFASMNGPGRSQLNYGGLEASSGDRYGAYWKDLTHNQITVYRHLNDASVDSIRVRIWVIK